MKYIIRAEQQQDYQGIYEILTCAFEQKNEAVFVDELRKKTSFIPELSLVAGFCNRILGHVLFYPVHIESEERVFRTLSLAPMCVHPDFQRKGIGASLIKRGLEESGLCGFDSVVVLGHANYYPRFGFKRASTWNIKAPFEVPDESFMAIELKKGVLAGRSGIVRYPKEFNEV